MFRPAQYLSLLIPYPGPYRDISKKAAKDGFEAFMYQRDWRTDNVIEFLKTEGKFNVSRESKLVEIDVLPNVLTSLGGRKPAKVENYKFITDRVPAQFRDFAKSVLPKWEPDAQLAMLSYDAAILWGEIFIDKYPEAQWAIGIGPKDSVNYQFPVVIGVDPYRMEFNPVRDMAAIVSDVICGGTVDNDLSRISSHSAASLGLDVDPNTGLWFYRK